MCPSPGDATTESAPPPEREERAPEDLAGGGSRFNGRLRGMLVVAMVALVVGTLLLAGVERKTRSSESGSQASSAHTDSGRTLRLNGTTEAVQSRAILAPLLAGEQVGTLTITKLALGGSRVKRGDILVEFDRQAKLRNFIDKQADHSSLVDQVIEEQAKENAARAKDETEIKQAEDNLSKAQLEMQKVELLSRIDAEKAQEDLDEATATLQQHTLIVIVGSAGEVRW